MGRVLLCDNKCCPLIEKQVVICGRQRTTISKMQLGGRKEQKTEDIAIDYAQFACSKSFCYSDLSNFLIFLLCSVFWTICALPLLRILGNKYPYMNITFQFLLGLLFAITLLGGLVLIISNGFVNEEFIENDFIWYMLIMPWFFYVLGQKNYLSSTLCEICNIILALIYTSKLIFDYKIDCQSEDLFLFVVVLIFMVVIMLIVSFLLPSVCFIVYILLN